MFQNSSRNRGLPPVGADGGSDFNRNIVEQSGGAEPGRDEQTGRAVHRRGPEFGVAHFEVIDVDRGYLREHGAGCAQRRLRTARCGMGAGQQRRRQQTGQFALRRIEIAVARRHRQAVQFAHDRHADDPGIDVEVGDHLPHQHQLLIVLLSEENSVRVHNLQQLEHHGQHAGEMGGPRSTLEFGSERTRMYGGSRAVGIHRRSAWRESYFNPFAAQQRQVGVDDPRVGVEILVGSELQRVDEDRHHNHRAGHPFGRPHEGEVSVVQSAHRRHQHHPSTGMAQRAADVADIPEAWIHVEFAGIELRRPVERHRADTSRTWRTSLEACARSAVRNAFTR